MAMAIENRRLLAPEKGRAVWKNTTILPKLSELFWAGLCLILFMILGPFSAPVALIAVFRLAGDGSEIAEPEPLET